jgi:hypothetical protein
LDHIAFPAFNCAVRDIPFILAVQDEAVVPELGGGVAVITLAAAGICMTTLS